MKYTKIAALIFLGISTLGVTARAASIMTYYDFTSYGTVSGGNTITSNSAIGFNSALATVKSDATSLTSSGLAISSGTNAGTTGVTMAGNQLAGFTGDFSLQIWYTTGFIGNNSMLYGGTTSATQDGSLAGDQALFAGYNGSAGFIRPIVSNGTQFGATMSNTTAGTGADTSTLYDYVVTYDSATNLFTAYMDGTSVGTLTVSSGFDGLSALTSGFAIGGVQNPAFGDSAVEVNITSFMMYEGVLDATTVSDLNALGSTPTRADFESAGIVVVPEPHGVTLAIMGLLGMMMVFICRRNRQA